MRVAAGRSHPKLLSATIMNKISNDFLFRSVAKRVMMTLTNDI